ncbi:aldehyde dehydrogenase family protein [Sphingomonas sp. AAP5]|uniref:aldehyde dehydrogenase family protein n=1 Tax=Sphingomonas sp. AAP5 TaxID=1523415 RepID=UPI00105758BE|nr:aldehyde dehydrogenase family protein [Sphingomonas sp. AAP5]QBM75065.1 aldehyde dehydrogenase family protein [Sphingomonas sp. AAP5]
MAYKLLIDGQLTEGAATLDVIDPATGRVFETCARADEAQLDAAVAAAKAAFPIWAARPHAERRACLEKLADAMEARQEEFCNLLTREQGKPTPQAQFEIGGSIAALRYFGAQELPLEMIRETAAEKILEQRTPLGVIAAITPWNFPVILLMLKLAPALAIGNTMVAKPAPSTPLTTALLGELAADILPPGVLNIIIDANDLGAALTNHADVDKVSFTGSTATGKRVMASAAGTLKRLTLELGGNDAAIILDDADVKAVARPVFDAAMINAGQVCLAVKRVYAPRAMMDDLCAEFARLGAAAVVDDGLNQGAQVGPLQNRQQYEKVLELIDDAKMQGTVVVGGERLGREGYFIAPTVIRDLPEDARLVREEQFGPVFPVLAYDSLDEVIDRANDSEFGLGGTIWTSNPERGLEVAMRIQSGTVWVNKHLDMPFDIPFGGAKQSGIGREQGLDGMKEFTQAKIINVARLPLPA